VYASVVEDAVVVGGLYFAAALAAVCHKTLIVHEPLTNQQMQKRYGVKMNEDKINPDVESLSTKTGEEVGKEAGRGGYVGRRVQEEQERVAASKPSASHSAAFSSPLATRTSASASTTTRPHAALSVFIFNLVMPLSSVTSAAFLHFGPKNKFGPKVSLAPMATHRHPRTFDDGPSGAAPSS
jgi:hypothetical protein